MTPTTTPSRQAANYGLDAPGVVRTMALLAFALILASVALGFAASASTKRLGRTLLWPAASFAITPVLMILSSRFGKLRARDRLLDVLAFRGNETVLDVGCGHGLMLIGAAHGSRGGASSASTSGRRPTSTPTAPKPRARMRRPRA